MLSPQKWGSWGAGRCNDVPEVPWLGSQGTFLSTWPIDQSKLYLKYCFREFRKRWGFFPVASSLKVMESHFVSRQVLLLTWPSPGNCCMSVGLAELNQISEYYQLLTSLIPNQGTTEYFLPQGEVLTLTFAGDGRGGRLLSVLLWFQTWTWNCLFLLRHPFRPS